MEKLFNPRMTSLYDKAKVIENSLIYCATHDTCEGCPFNPLYGDCNVDDLKIESANIISQLFKIQSK